VIATEPAKSVSEHVYALSSDGSRLVTLSNEGLPARVPITSITSRDDQPILVSANGFIWAHASEVAPSWAGYPAPRTSTEGSSPLFAQ
jgi:hypothetical protein